ncbi:MAG TPA: isoleucine--tRNA ligase [Gemmatimonadaceae bacterium]|nr:isoleucine--tRNA ligase [Gemmatimonadaceae bacterium]
MTAGVPVEMRYRILSPDRSPDDLEQETLARWTEEQLFECTQAATVGRPEFVFFEGPPTANGRPGIHHVFARTVKDLFCRHRAMQGFHVTRKAGWDTHGLPVEIEVEKRLGISGKQDIEKYGVELFNRMCRESVFTYRVDWERLSERIGYWLDYSDPYVTYSNDYVESVWWALKTLFDKGRLYRGHKILPYCARCGTALSSHEVAQGYRDVIDPSVYIALDLADQPTRRRIIVWTTTPWTLVSNVALAVNPELEYIELRKRTGKDDETIILARSRAGGVLGQDYQDRWDTVSSMYGRDLVGMRYQRPLDWVEYGEGAHEVIIAESFVTADDGSGVVHMAPAFGADDYAAGKRNGLAFLQPVDSRGRFPETLPLVGGQFVKDADPAIIEELKRRGVLWKAQQFEHAYPHCWRCDTPLLYYARTSWFVRTTDFKDGMLARNDQVDWHPPEVGAGRFGEWLKNNIDWAVSRDRYWGTPLPLWVNDENPDEIEAIGSYAELTERIGHALTDDFDPHKPYIDRYTWPAKSGTGTMRRVPEVIDAWFDSGSMPFAQWHYPFERQEMFLQHYPADFIDEGIDQTRGWFYSLLSIATGLGDSLPQNETGAAPYRSVVVNDLLLAKDGTKMSKSRGNTVDPWAVLATHGADAIRLFLIASSQIWMPRRFDEDGIRETAGRFLITFKNIYSGIFALYANFGWSPSPEDPAPADRPLIDRWILSRLATVEQTCDTLLTQFDATLAVRAIMDFVVDDVSNWYVRLNRHRFYDVTTADNRAAFATLHEVLAVVCRLLAPFAPFIADWIHRELTGESVHLASYVRPEKAPIEPILEQTMSHVRTLSTLGRAARETAGIKVRQPLATMVCVVPYGADAEMLKPLVSLLATELNVKDVVFASSADDLVTLEARANFRSLGKKFGKQTPLAAAAIQAFGSEALRRFEHGGDLEVAVGNESHPLSPDDITIVRRAAGDLVVQEEGGYFAAIDPTVTPELLREGIAREIVSRVQRLRKELGFAVSDRITLKVFGDDTVQDVVMHYREWIAEEVLALDVPVAPLGNEDNATHRLDLDGRHVDVAITRIA